MTILRRLTFFLTRSAVALGGPVLILACLSPSLARGDSFGSWNGFVTAYAQSQGYEKIEGEPCVFEDATQLCHLFDNEQFSLGTVAIPALGIYPAVGSASALIDGTSLTVSASTQRFADGSISDGTANAGLGASGVVSVGGGGIAALKLLDQLVNQFAAGTGKASGYIDVGARWGPYNSATGVTEITHATDYNYELGAGACSPGATAYISGIVSNLENTSCLEPNSNAGIQIPLDVADGNGLLIYVEGHVYSQGAGTCQ